MRIAITLAAILAACGDPRPSPIASSPSASPPGAASASARTDEARAVALQLVEAARPCDPVAVARFIDVAAFGARYDRLADEQARALRKEAEATASPPVLALKLCAWLEGAQHLQVLRVRHVDDGDLRPLLRKVSATSLAYFDLLLVRSTPGGPIQIADVYSHNEGAWISEAIASIGMQAPAADAATVALITKVTELQSAGAAAEALATLDQLPAAIRTSKPIQRWRLTLAGEISVDAYARALDELTRLHPDRAFSGFERMNRAFLVRDFAAALAAVDDIDAGVGGDPFLDALRAMIRVQRQAPGDLDAADRLADAAIRAEPSLAWGVNAKLAIAVTRQQWAAALALMDRLIRDHGVTLDDAAVRASPGLAPLLATPEYAAWRARNP